MSKDAVKSGLKPMHRTPAEKKAEDKKYSSPAKAVGKSYAYGTRMDLGEEEHAKLGIKGSHAVGTELAIHARAKVISSSVSEDDGSGPRRSMALQITHMGLNAPEGPKAPGTLKRYTPKKPAPEKAPTPAAKLSKVRRA